MFGFFKPREKEPEREVHSLGQKIENYYKLAEISDLEFLSLYGVDRETFRNEHNLPKEKPGAEVIQMDTTEPEEQLPETNEEDSQVA
jgi:hypothetical protein